MTLDERSLDVLAKFSFGILILVLESPTGCELTRRINMSANTEEVKAEDRQDIQIIVNAEQHVVRQRRLAFEDVVRLAFADAIFNNDIIYTVTYKRGPHQNREGSLVAGETVSITNGMIFNAKRTDKS